VRPFIAEGRFQEVANSVVAGDFAVIKFGHNDGGSPQGKDNGRRACYGAGSETSTTPAGLVVQTFRTYLIAAAKLMTTNGARVIITATTPNNPRETRSFVYSPGGFATYARDSAPKVGGLASFVNHGQYTANIYQTLGGAKINSYFP
jgi:rhamnogalacturonan acetylesterase